MSINFRVRHVISLLAITLMGAAFAPAANSQPIQLLKDLRYGFWPDDSREVVQVGTTSESLVMVSRRRYGSYYDSMFHLNVLDGNDTDYQYGLPLGEDDNFGFGITPDGNGMANYPFFCFRNGKIIFSYAYKTNYYRYVSLDPSSRDLTPLTNLRYTPVPFASWNLPDGKIGFVRKADGRPEWEVCRFNPDLYESIEVTTSIPYLKPEVAGSITVGPVRVLNGLLIFTAVEEGGKTISVYRTNGTAVGTESLFSISDNHPKDLCMVQGLGKIFFGINESSGSTSLYKTDGTVAGTELVSDTLDSQFRVKSTYEYTESSSTLFWINPIDESIFATDGLTVRELPPLPQSDYYPVALAWLQDQLHITAYDGGVASKRLYVTDGYTAPVRQINANGLSSIFASEPTSSGTLVYSDIAIYLVNGPLKDALLLVYSAAHGDTSYFPQVGTFKNEVIFNRRKTGDQPTDQFFLLKTASPHQPLRLTNFTQTPVSSDPGDFIKFNDRVLFTDTALENRLSSGYTYSTDGSPQTTNELFSANVNWLGVSQKGVLFKYGFGDWPDGAYQDPSIYSTDGIQGSIAKEIAPNYSFPYPPSPTKLFDDKTAAYIGSYIYPSPSVLVTDGQIRDNYISPNII